MVKAYLKYVQQDVLGGLVGNKSNIITCTVVSDEGLVKSVYLVSACNEVVNLTNMKTGEIVYKVYNKEAQHGFITCLAATNGMLAVGYSSGTV